MNTKNYHSNELEKFKKNHKERIVAIAELKTEWMKDFIETQKPKPEIKTVADLYKEFNNEHQKNTCKPNS
ncbi:hypothetical protein [Chryseobacterium daeguense]|uniref:hypothetical protein n=1 Tax=Chryseobacterium daeguense TaxID=412438 RepID=UPI00040A2371|nr:hypothetical protein [Chryseobacterium daeguense]